MVVWHPDGRTKGARLRGGQRLDLRPVQLRDGQTVFQVRSLLLQTYVVTRDIDNDDEKQLPTTRRTVSAETNEVGKRDTILDAMNHKENKDDGNDDRPSDDGGRTINDNDNDNSIENGRMEAKYNDCMPLVESIAKYSKQREECFQHYHPSRQRVLTYPTGNDSWIRTVCCVCRGRAFHRVAGPFILVNVHTIIINTLLQFNYISFTSSSSSNGSGSNNDDYEEETDSSGADASGGTPHADWMVLIYGWILTAVSFLLVFRLNRAGTRYWLARQCWGIIIARCRTLVSGILVHGGGIGGSNRSQGGGAAFARDNAIRWIITLVVTIMTYLKEDDENSTNSKAKPAVIPSCSLDGILTKIRYSSGFSPSDDNEQNACGGRDCKDVIDDDDDEEIRQLQAVSHPPIYASDRARHYLKEVFLPANNNSSSYSYYHVKQFQYLESQLDTICDQLGAMERIKYTPLPIAHVSHLRTYLLLHLLLFPYVFCSSSSTSGNIDSGVSYTDWLFIPITCIIISFAFLGIEAASSEVESPFHQNHINNLHMDSFVVTIMRNVQQQLTTYHSK